MISTKYLFERFIPNALRVQYMNLGWSIEQSNYGLVGKKPFAAISSSGAKAVKLGRLAEPKLLKLEILRPLGAYLNLPLESVIRVNQPEEFEAHIDQFLASFFVQFQMCGAYKARSISAKIGQTDFILRMYGCFDGPSKAVNYERLVAEFFQDPNNLPTRLKQTWDGESKIDLWFDVENAVIMSFDKNFINRVDSHLKVSFQTRWSAKL